MIISLLVISVACRDDDRMVVEEPEVMFLEGEFILHDSTGSPCDLYFQTESGAYHLGNPYNEYFEAKAYFFKDTQQVVMTYDVVKDGSECNKDFVQSTVSNLVLYEQLEVMSNNELFQEVTTAGISIDSAQLLGDYLILDYRSSGCLLSEWEPYLVESEEVLESFPPQRNLKLVTHPIGGCAATKRKRGIFNVKELQVDGGVVILNIAYGFNEEIESITYSY
ncbi:MAG: hypothetical protein R8G66_09975 [Cytophagales bacterium]|nr:hypothetical protein [Cytophagales bacterium]